MSYDDWVHVWIVAAAFPATAFVIFFPILSPTFWRSWIGRGLWTSSFGLAVLLDLALAARWYGVILPTWAGLAILIVIALGAWLKFVALFRAKWLVWRGRASDSTLA